jgi:hypothetical protein
MMPSFLGEHRPVCAFYGIATTGKEQLGVWDGSSESGMEMSFKCTFNTG